ncbi:DNA mismatch endonuclease Vsr [Gemmatimonas sp.]|uniref:DNA mismatch endonuclease Vsr n=1 Tax=Gemmatimonas sp. TaxID=1962908 RepID=UPI00356329E2
MTGRPKASSPAVREQMQRQRRRDTGPERLLRGEIWSRGLRYRIDFPIIDRRRRHDIVFTRAKVVVDVRGCFWHGCSDHGTIPKSNWERWSEKLEANRRRDADTVHKLEEAGWLTLVVWEHDDLVAAADEVEALVRSRPENIESQRSTVLNRKEVQLWQSMW